MKRRQYPSYGSKVKFRSKKRPTAADALLERLQHQPGPEDVLTCSCGQDFLPHHCEEHCSPKCCAANDCVNRTWGHDDKYPPRPQRRCRVCGRSKDLFLPFPSCVRSRTGDFEEDGFYYRPVPGAPVRRHLDYCSAFCYTHSTSGHWARAGQGARRRKRRQYERWLKGLSPNPRGRLAV